MEGRGWWGKKGGEVSDAVGKSLHVCDICRQRGGGASRAERHLVKDSLRMRKGRSQGVPTGKSQSDETLIFLGISGES